jgi:hypothetical protein
MYTDHRRDDMERNPETQTPSVEATEAPPREAELVDEQLDEVVGGVIAVSHEIVSPRYGE